MIHATLRVRAISAATAALMLLALTVQMGLAGVTPVVFTDFSDSSELTLNEDAAIATEGGQEVLRVTPAASGQAGSAFLTDAISLAADASFSTTFSFQITASGGAADSDGPGADGLVFVVQTVSNTAGGAGGGIGYQGLDNSVGIEFDTWDNGEISGNHVGIDFDGSVTSTGSTNIVTRMNDGNVWHAWVDYNGATDVLEVRLAQSNVRPALATLSLNSVDLPTVLGATDAFVGFTSGTGAAWGNHDIRSWTFISTFNPVGVNEPPVADAGPDQTVAQTPGGTEVTLDGTGSTDPDGDTLTYFWTGPFNGGTMTGATPTVTFPAAGAHEVMLQVDDGNTGTDSDTVTITVQASSGATATPAPTASQLPDSATGTHAAPVTGLAMLFALLFLVSAHRLAYARHRNGRR